MTLPPGEKTVNLEALARRIPQVSDKALVDLVNGIHVNREMTCFRRRRSFLQSLLDSTMGRNREWDLLFDGNLVSGQDALFRMISEIRDKLTVSELACVVTQRSLQATRASLKSVEARSAKHSHEIARLQYGLAVLETDFQRIAELESRIERIEAIHAVEAAISACEADRTYSGFHWLLQLTLLVREIYAGKPGRYEAVQGDGDLRELVIDKIDAFLKRHSVAEDFSIVLVCEEACHDLPKLDLEISGAILDSRSLPQVLAEQMPNLFFISTCLELNVIPENVRPLKTAECAWALCREKIDPMFSRLFSRRKLVEDIVREWSAHGLALRSEEEYRSGI